MRFAQPAGCRGGGECPVLVGVQLTTTTLAVPAIVLAMVSPDRANVQDVMLIVAGVPMTVMQQV